MIQQRHPTTTTRADPALHHYRHLIWAFWWLNSLVLFPICLDWQLAPRFFTLAFFTGIALVLLWKDLHKHADWHFTAFDIALTGWCLLNFASTFWAFSWSEALFFAQKTGLFLAVYWLIRQALFRDEPGVLKALQQATFGLTVIVILATTYEISRVAWQQGFHNQHLYDHVKILYGNKSLTTDFLFFLLIFNGLCLQLPAPKVAISNRVRYLIAGLMVFLVLLIILLQTRTVYLAVAGAGALWLVLSAFDPNHILRYKKRWLLPWLLAGAGAVYGIACVKGYLPERLNPLTYLDSDTANERRFVWYKTDLLNQDHYWWGVGDGSWKFRWPEKGLQGGHRMEHLEVAFTRAHNDYLEVRAELGMVGILWFCMLFVWVAAAGLYTWYRHTAEGHFDKVLPILLAGVFGYCIIQYFDFPRERIEMQVVLALLFALCSHFSVVFWQKMPKISLRPKERSLFLIFLALNTAGGLVIGWHRISGEIHNVRLLQAAARKDNAAVIRETRAAMNPFYEYDEVGLPLPWYEGSAYQQLQQMEQALAAFKRAADLNPWNYQCLNNCATLMVQTAANDPQKLKTAAALLEKAVYINPRHHDAKFNLAYTLWQLGDVETARYWVENVDTLRRPVTDDDRAYNQFIQNRQAAFRNMLQQKPEKSQ